MKAEMDARMTRASQECMETLSAHMTIDSSSEEEPEEMPEKTKKNAYRNNK